MASLHDIRRRIKSVKSTEKITRAMKMVAAAKLRRAQEEVRCARPYSSKLKQVISHLARRIETLGEEPHPLLENRVRKGVVEVLVMTSDRGLCGAFNSNVARRAHQFIGELKQDYKEVYVSTLGKKGFESMTHGRHPIKTNYEGVLAKGDIVKAHKIAKEVCDRFIQEDLDGVWLVYNEFKSAISQSVVVKKMLPVEPVEIDSETADVDYVYEPGKHALLDHLVPRHFTVELHQAFLESLASEHGSRMTSMDNATRNAKEMTGKLTLTYNRARQAAITKELMEIIGGAEALS